MKKRDLSRSFSCFTRAISGVCTPPSHTDTVLGVEVFLFAVVRVFFLLIRTSQNLVFLAGFLLLLLLIIIISVVLWKGRSPRCILHTEDSRRTVFSSLFSSFLVCLKDKERGFLSFHDISMFPFIYFFWNDEGVFFFFSREARRGRDDRQGG